MYIPVACWRPYRKYGELGRLALFANIDYVDWGMNVDDVKQVAQGKTWGWQYQMTFMIHCSYTEMLYKKRTTCCVLTHVPLL